jgi:hypothetical protein
MEKKTLAGTVAQGRQAQCHLPQTQNKIRASLHRWSAATRAA